LGITLLISRGVRLLTASGDDLTATDDPTRKMMRQIAGAFAEYEKARLVSKLRHARERVPDEIRRRIVEMALDEPELSPRELAARFTDTQNYFVSEASVYRLLKARDLITSPAFIVIKAADEFKDKTTAINQLWQTDFTYLKVIGWGWFYLSTILDDYSRYIIACCAPR
jgi:transposase InsO family protein